MMMDERAEADFINAVAPIKRSMGEDAFRACVISIGLEKEEWLRANTPADHPMLLLLDQYHEEQKADAWKNG